MTPPFTQDEFIAHLGQILARYRLDLTHEKKTQEQIGECLAINNIAFDREYRMENADGKTDIPDFFVSGIVLEVKANRASASKTITQLTRYASHETVNALILVTNKAMDLPASINGKPVHSVSTGKAWL